MTFNGRQHQDIQKWWSPNKVLWSERKKIGGRKLWLLGRRKKLRPWRKGYLFRVSYGRAKRTLEATQRLEFRACGTLKFCWNISMFYSQYYSTNISLLYSKYCSGNISIFYSKYCSENISIFNSLYCSRNISIFYSSIAVEIFPCCIYNDVVELFPCYIYNIAVEIFPYFIPVLELKYFHIFEFTEMQLK